MFVMGSIATPKLALVCSCGWWNFHHMWYQSYKSHEVVQPLLMLSWSTFNSDRFARSLIFCDNECWMCYTFICSHFILSSTSLHARPSWTHHHHIITLQNTTHFNGLATFHNMESRGPFMYFNLGMNYEKYSWNSHGHYEDNMHDYVENRLCMKCSRVQTRLKNLWVKILMYFQSKLFSIVRLVTHCLWYALRWGDLLGKNLAKTDYFGIT
jgi:hypothetical protein